MFAGIGMVMVLSNARVLDWLVLSQENRTLASSRAAWFWLYLKFCKRSSELPDSGGAHPAGFPNHKGNPFAGVRSAEATFRSNSERFAAGTWSIFKTPSFVFGKKSAACSGSQRLVFRPQGQLDLVWLG